MDNVTVLTWVVGITAALVIAMLAAMINLTYQVDQIAGKLSVLIDHVELK